MLPTNPTKMHAGQQSWVWAENLSVVLLLLCMFLNMLLTYRGLKYVYLNTKMVNFNISQITPEKQNREGLWFSEKRKKGHAYYSGLCNILRRIQYFYVAFTHPMFLLGISAFKFSPRYRFPLKHAHAHTHTPTCAHLFALLILKQYFNCSYFTRQMSLNAFCENYFNGELHWISRHVISF